MKLKYLRRIPADPNSPCGSHPDGWEYFAVDGRYADFWQVSERIRRPSDRVAFWISESNAVTSKGLRTTDSIAKLKKLYPNAIRRVETGEYGTKYSRYTVSGPKGYLDIIRHWVPGKGVADNNFFTVRAKNVGFAYMVDILTDC